MKKLEESTAWKEWLGKTMDVWRAGWRGEDDPTVTAQVVARGELEIKPLRDGKPPLMVEEVVVQRCAGVFLHSIRLNWHPSKKANTNLVQGLAGVSRVGHP